MQLSSLSDEHLKAIGRVVVYFSLLDEALSFRICSLIGYQNNIGNVITAELSFKQKVNLFSSLFCHLQKTTQEPSELKSLIDRISTAEEERNKILHSLWVVGTSSDMVIRLKATAKRRKGQSGFKAQAKPMLLQDINRIADSILDLFYDLIKSTGVI